MKSELERAIMESIYMAGSIYVRNYFRFNEILGLSGVKKSSLQGILERLEKRKWLEKKTTYSYSDKNPKGKIDFVYFIPSKKKDSSDILISKNMLEKYMKEFPKLKRKKIYITLRGEKITEEKTFAQIVEEIHPRKRSKSLKKGIKMPGLAKLIEKILKEEKGKKYTFFRLNEFPFLYRIPGGHVPSDYNDKIVPPWNFPKRTKRFWKNSANDMKYLIKKWKGVIPRHEINFKLKLTL